MKALHMPRLHRPETSHHAVADFSPDNHSLNHPDHPHHPPITKRLQRLEGMVDMITILLMLIFGAVMVFGLLTATGDTSWMK